MLSKNHQALKKHLTFLAVIFMVIVPLINNFVLSFILSNIYGDIMFKTVSEILKVFIAALDTLNLFLVFAVLAISIVRYGIKYSKDIITLCVVRIVIVYGSYLAIGAIITTNFAATISGNLIYCLSNSVIDVLLLIGALVLCSLLRARFIGENNTDITIKKFVDRKNPLLNVILWVTVLISAFLLSGCVINTITDIATYGAKNLNVSEVIYLVKPYIIWGTKAVFGYFVMALTAKWIDILWKSVLANDEKER